MLPIRESEKRMKTRWKMWEEGGVVMKEKKISAVGARYEIEKKKLSDQLNIVLLLFYLHSFPIFSFSFSCI